MAPRSRQLRDDDFARLLAFRDGLRRFQRWSEDQAKRVGLTPAQHQLLLAVRGHRGSPPSIREIAEHLLLRHHSVVELVDRAVAAGLVERLHDDDDQRVVRLHLTPAGAERVEALAGAHLEELSRLRPRFDSLWADLPEG
jgi:DNA-binding MarR family transcriptional regulator